MSREGLGPEQEENRVTRVCQYGADEATNPAGAEYRVLHQRRRIGDCRTVLLRR